MDMEKKCSICGELKPCSEYTKSNSAKDGLDSRCRDCKSISRKMYYEKNKEREIESSKQYQAENKSTCKEKQKQWRIKNKKKISERRKNHYLQNKDRALEIAMNDYIKNRDHKLEIKKKWGRTNALFLTYIDKFLPFPDEEIRDDGSGYINARCTYCGKWFAPSNIQVSNRLGGFYGRIKGEGRFYCSEECKKACPVYGRIDTYRGQKIGFSREVPAEFRQIALKDRNYTCEKCGSQENGLHVHHIEGYTEQPMLAADLVNVIVVCKVCHRIIHKQPGCRYVDYQCKDRAKAA